MVKNIYTKQNRGYIACDTLKIVFTMKFSHHKKTTLPRTYFTNADGRDSSEMGLLNCLKWYSQVGLHHHHKSFHDCEELDVS